MHHEVSAPRDGIVVASGYGLKIYVDRGHLIIHDGVGRERRAMRFSRATSGLTRLVVIGHAGYVTLEALRWVRDIGASFAQIGRDGDVITISGAERFHNTKLRRAQVLAADSPVGLGAIRQLLAAKLEHQAKVADGLSHLKGTLRLDGKRREVSVGQAIREQAVQLERADSFKELRLAESIAGRYYWTTFARVPIRFDSAWTRAVPAHWHTAGPRTPKRGRKRPENATTPIHALLNYGYAILQVEATIALHRLGLDPSLGIMHVDRHYRGSLATDLMEACRPRLDQLVLELVGERAFGRGDLLETRRGVCRLGASLAHELAAFATPLRRCLAPHAEQLATTLSNGRDGRTPLTRANNLKSRGVAQESPA